MKRLVSAFFFVFFVFEAMGQFGHEWIQFGQPYLKIPVGREGLYRITFDNLQQSGFSSSGDPKNLRLFHRGIEQSIAISGEADGVFDASDYIEFFGRANDGTLDSSLYEDPSHQPHPYYNLYSDTTSYFLTLGPGPGKRMALYTAPASGLTAETHHWEEKMLMLTSSYASGRDYGSVQQSTFDEGEGWMGAQILHGQELSYVLAEVTDPATMQGKPHIEVSLTGRGPMVHNIELFAGTRLLSTLSFTGYQSFLHAQDIEWSDVDAQGKVTIKVRVTGAEGADRVSVGYIRLKFPQRLNLHGAVDKMLFLSANPDDISLLKLEEPLPGIRVFDVTDPADARQISTTSSAATLDVVINGTSEHRKIFLAAQGLPVSNATRVVFRDIDPRQHNYIIISHPLLRKPAMGYLDPVKAYAEYRSFPEGGGFDTLTLNIGQLYDQFNYGERSPRAIFQFMKFFLAQNIPDYLFLVGKGLDVNYDYGRSPSAFAVYKDLVPSAGYPASDMAFTSGLNGAAHVPGVATGRLTATSPAEIAAYLNKVKEREALPFDDLNRKKILHLSGGIEENEPVFFRDILRGIESVAEGVFLGGEVQAIAKQSTETKLINIADEVNQGLGLITFFGHSAPNTTDFDIGLVTDPVMGYDNTGKYPFLLMNGCDAGSFFLNANIFGENWIKARDKGAIGFIAHSSYGLVPSLARYSSTFYSVAFGDSTFIKRGVGKVQQEVARRYLEETGPSPQAITQVQQMVLLGDPAIKLFGAEKPDYAVDDAGISVSSFNSEALTALTDSFRIHIPLRNFGIGKGMKIRISVNREFNDRVVVYDSIIDAVLNSETVTLVLRNPDKDAFGINRFSVRIDADNLVDELSETNNEGHFEYFFPLNGTRNLYPYNFSIVNNRTPDLSFQYTDLIGDSRAYLLEIDTAKTFDSGFKQEFHISARVLARQRVELLSKDSTVYYWRTRVASPAQHESTTWTTSSFSYIHSGPEGWAQLRFPQFETNAASGLVKDPVIRKLQYEETVSDLAIQTFATSAGKPLDSVSFKINGVEFNLLNEGGACRNNTINLVAFDRHSTQPYAGIYFKWYELLYEYGGRRLLCGREPYVINSFTTQELITGNDDDLSQYVDNVHEGDSVVLFNLGNAGYSQWPAAAFTKLSELGISGSQLEGLQDGDAVIIFGRKGAAPGTARIFRTSPGANFLRIDETMSGGFSAGSMSSPLIGPAQRWDGLSLKVTDVESVDDFEISIVGITSSGTTDTLRTNIRTDEDLSSISADEYPHLRVVFESRDDINLTSVQLARWLVTYEPVAEGLLYYDWPAGQQVLFEGQISSSDFGFINVSDKLFPDSLLVQYDLVNHSDPVPAPSMRRIKAPLPGDTTLFTVLSATASHAGLNDLAVFVNPRAVKEQVYDNNLIVLSQHLAVIGDNAHPLMEVTFDGKVIENNEFVSADPAIVIRLWDENPFMKKVDTLGVNIFLAAPCADGLCDFARIYFSRDDIAWKPADDISDFEVYFSPRQLATGVYRMRVEAADASGNLADAPYEIDFRVEHSPSVHVDAPYPNPFFVETYFNVLVSGPYSSGYFYTLELLNADGRLVSAFSGPEQQLTVGKNTITWTGNDHEGRSLPNGIYLYRLSIRTDERVIEHRGKVVLIR